MADFLDTVTGAITNTLAQTIKRITVETAWLPPIVIDDPLAPTPPGQESTVVRTLKPKITIELSTGAPIVSAPYGTPTQNWPMLRNIAIGLGIYFVGLKVVVSARRRQRKRLVAASAPVAGLAAYGQARSRSRARPRAHYTTW